MTGPPLHGTALFFKVSRETQKATKIFKSYECLVVTDLGTVFN